MRSTGKKIKLRQPRFRAENIFRTIPVHLSKNYRMHPSRRNFLKQTALTAAGISLFSKNILASLSRPKHITGLQLYTVRDDMKKNPVDTLAQLSAAGYRYVEHANYVNRKFYGFSAAEFKKILEDHIGAEDKRHPLADEKLTDILKEAGYNIARRTVAKYREQMNIPVARLRKEL